MEAHWKQGGSTVKARFSRETCFYDASIINPVCLQCVLYPNFIPHAVDLFLTQTQTCLNLFPLVNTILFVYLFSEIHIPYQITVNLTKKMFGTSLDMLGMYLKMS